MKIMGKISEQLTWGQ